ncbi:MAG: UDP-N-acetylmuramoyl-tripeptide--D-alanyl-D-alanine ligase [Ardenticatenaceae bacterium]|nr:UDP-N-acetylmuramoyl-tripeptide--D-alanyl-D-alanine ligase [Ardenticatenaceae bacterium]
MPTLSETYTGLTGRVAPVGSAAPLIAGFAVDSRQVKAGGCFVARPGEQTDGHHFIPQALAAGAIAVIAERDRLPAGGDALKAGDAPPGRLYGAQVVDLGVPATEPLQPPVIFVADDSLAAMQRLAGWWRDRVPGLRVIGITGSVGKTTLKELTAAVLRQRYRTFRSAGNLNSDIGLPVTILDMPLDSERAVLEMGMTRPGELTELAAIARPVVAVVTNVGPSHLARLGSLEAITSAKAELVQTLPAGGTAILNGDDERVSSMAALAPAGVTVLTYGLDPGNTIWASKIESHGLDGISFRFHYAGQNIAARLPLLGRHSVHASLAAAGVGLVEGQSWAEIISGLKDLAELEVLRLVVVPGINGSTLLDDTYNASPASVLAALNLLADLPGRHVAVLGNMLELGSYTLKGHQIVARRAVEICELLVTIGELGQLIADEALASGFDPAQLFATSDRAAAVAWLHEHLQPNDMVLIKASHGVRLDEVTNALVETPRQADPPDQPAEEHP